MKKGMLVFLMVFASLYGFDFSRATELVYPTEPIEIVVGYAPGGGTDLGARLIAEKAKNYLGKELVVINKAGGSGRLAMTLLAKAKPDGYTLGATTDTCLINTPHIEPVSYKPLEDFTFIVQYGILDTGLVVLSDSPFHSFKELIEFGRTNPEKFGISTVGVGTTTQVALEFVAKTEGVKMKVVPFSGGAPAMTALLGGHVIGAAVGTSVFSQHLKAKKVRLLTVFGEERVKAYPEVPTFKELGYPITLDNWYLIAGPNNIEKTIVNKLAEVFKKAMESTEFIKLARDLEFWTKEPLSGDGLKEGIIRRYRTNGEMFKRIGIGVKQ